MFAGTAGQDAIAVYNNTTQDQPPKLDSPAPLNPGNSATLAGFVGAGELLCETCDFLKWGFWTATVNFKDDHNLDTTVMATGLWVTGDVIKDVVGALPLDGTAYYEGNAFGMVVTDLFNDGMPYAAEGGMEMSWDFGSRTGRFDVTDFDSYHIDRSPGRSAAPSARR